MSSKFQDKQNRGLAQSPNEQKRFVDLEVVANRHLEK
jgi:hypothetical protein